MCIVHYDPSDGDEKNRKIRSLKSMYVKPVSELMGIKFDEVKSEEFNKEGSLGSCSPVVNEDCDQQDSFRSAANIEVYVAL